MLGEGPGGRTSGRLVPTRVCPTSPPRLAGDLWNAPGRTAFTLRVRAVSAGGCKIDQQGIVQMDFDVATATITKWDHFWDSDWNGPEFSGTCT